MAVEFYAIGLKVLRKQGCKIGAAGWTPRFASVMKWVANNSGYEKK